MLSHSKRTLPTSNKLIYIVYSLYTIYIDYIYIYIYINIVYTHSIECLLSTHYNYDLTKYAIRVRFVVTSQRAICMLMHVDADGTMVCWYVTNTNAISATHRLIGICIWL